jgi:hypothetical protein
VGAADTTGTLDPTEADQASDDGTADASPEGDTTDHAGR